MLCYYYAVTNLGIAAADSRPSVGTPRGAYARGT